MSERLTKRDENGNAYYDWGYLNRNHWALGRHVDRLAAYEDSNLSPEEVQELAKAKAEGRLVVLPCKTEDTVFIVYAKKILETTVDKRAWTDDDGYMLRTKEEWFKEKDISKIVFLSREEAEKALEGLGTRKQRGY